MIISLKGQTALVTGGSHGIGLSIADALAKTGARVIICGRNSKRLLRAQSTLLENGLHVSVVPCDVTNISEVRGMFSAIKVLDILVNNAGGAEKFGSFFDLEDKDWHNAWMLNFMSAVNCSREAVPLLQQSTQPRIVNIASVSAHQPGAFNPHYSAAKAALLNLSKHLANILAKNKILVNAICPSTLKGGGWYHNVRDRAAREGINEGRAEMLMLEEENKKSPLGFIGLPRDVAALCVFLASKYAGYITGHCFNVDGGITRAV